MALDERLRRELERAARPADPSGVYEELIRRRERRRVFRRAQHVALAVAVIAGSAGGVFGLSRVFRSTDDQTAATASNGLIVYSDIRVEGIGEGDGSGVDSSWHLFAVHPTNGRVMKIRPEAVDEALYPTWSPDGKRIAFVGYVYPPNGPPRGSLYIADADGTDTEVVFTPARGQHVQGVRWSPDGSRIGYELADTSPVPISERSWTIWTMDLDGSDRQQVTSIGREMHFSWSPDGTQIVFERFESVDDESQLGATPTDLFIVDADGGNEVQLTDDGMSRDPAWSPDGMQVAFSHGPVGDQRVAVVWIDGSGLRELAGPVGGFGVVPYGNTITWSPDGTLVAFAGRDWEGDVCSISSVAVDDGTVRALVSAPASRSCPGQEGMSWAPALEADPDGGATPTLEPTPTPSIEDGRITDVGLGLRLCDVGSVRGTFIADGSSTQTAFVGSEPTRTGLCPTSQERTGIAAIDISGDGKADIGSRPFECEFTCGAYAAPDVDADGTDELLVLNVGFSVSGVALFDVGTDGDAVSLVRAMVEPPGDATLGFEGFDGSGPPQFWIGGDAFTADSLRCEASAGGRVLVSVTAQQVPPDSPNSVWEVHETVFELDAGVLRVLDARDFSVPFDGGTPGFTGTGGCGADLGGP